MDGEEPTQATQNVLDPRRLGEQNSGFSDEDVSDIICILYPHSDVARQEVQRLAREDSPFIVGKDDADGLELDYDNEDDATNFDSNPIGRGNHAIILKLSASPRNPAGGFAFGRNRSRCDIVFEVDPARRISNVHFRIYVNEYGSVMIEDQSTNGTVVDGETLTSHPHPSGKPHTPRWLLQSGSIINIQLHQHSHDHTFRVRIPRRDEGYHSAYIEKVQDFFARHGLRAGVETIGAGPGGHVDLFPKPAQGTVTRPGYGDAATAILSPAKRKDTTQNVIRREWTGSGKYNRVGMIGKGAFAVVYKVTSKYDGKPYAAKELEKRRFIKNNVLDQKVDNEMRIMQRVKHPNIVQYIENFDWEDRLLIIIMEYIPGGDLGKLISEGQAFHEDLAKVLAKQLLSALGYLHENNITHRDVKPDNILINTFDPLDVKLTDFGLSKMVDTEQTFLRTFCGTLLYCAPEVYTEYQEYDDRGIRNRGQRVRRQPGQRYNHAVDIWSLGGVLFFTMTGAPPYPAKNGISYSELLHKIMTTRLDISPLQRQGVSAQGVDFLCRMLQRRPENRATVTDLMEHPWLGGSQSTIELSQSYDEITDDGELTTRQAARELFDYEDDRVSDSMGEESDKENLVSDGNINQPRLFGEVGASAIGSSGVIPEDFLNLPVGVRSEVETEILDSYEDDGYVSGESSTPRDGGRRVHRQSTVSMGRRQSADQLHSLVEDVASQSLGGNESVIKHMGSRLDASSRSLDFNSSKRKPPSYEASDEFDDNVSSEKPTMKRLKSEGTMEDISGDEIEEYKLLANIPQLRRLGSGRQVDGPVSKMRFWEQDRRTWHLRYPEMTQLQYDAFAQGARNRGEDFAVGKTPLWDLALKYFPPSTTPEDLIKKRLASPPVGLKRDDRRVDDTTEFPPTAAPPEPDSIPDTLVLPDPQIIVPVRNEDMPSRAVGMIESHSDSCIQNISFPIIDSLVSFGRGFDNTDVFEPRTEPRVPKYAFKIMLWKDGYDPAQNPSKVPHPWLRDDADDADTYSFWISSKASLGIRVNDYLLPSSNPKNPSAASQYWARLYDGDEILIWGTRTGDGVKTKQTAQTTLTFRCFWGASATRRNENTTALELAQGDAIWKLDSACQRTEKRIRDAREKSRKIAEAKEEDAERARQIERERERSRVFEAKRLEAVEFWQARQAQTQISRRASPAVGTSTGFASRTHTTT